MTANFCLQCGHALETRWIGDADRRACPACDYVFWGQYSIGVGAIVRKENRYLLVRRAQNPGKGNWTNPGGYIEQTEPFHETIEREVLEETGVTAKVKRIVAVRDQPREVHNVYIAFILDYVDGEPVPDGIEVDAAGFYGPDELDGMNVAGFTRWLIDVADREREKTGLHPDPEPGYAFNGFGFRV